MTLLDKHKIESYQIILNGLAAYQHVINERMSTPGINNDMQSYFKIQRHRTKLLINDYDNKIKKAIR